MAPEDVVYNSQPTLGPMAAMFVSRSETEDTAVAKATGVTFVERRGNSHSTNCTYIHVTQS